MYLISGKLIYARNIMINIVHHDHEQNISLLHDYHQQQLFLLFRGRLSSTDEY